METLVIILVFLVLAAIAAYLWLWQARNFLQELKDLKDNQQNITQNLQQSIITNQDTVNKNLQFHSQTLKDLSSQLGLLQGANSRIIELGTDIKSLQQILGSPKLRGSLGEWSLENVLASILPAESFTLQHSFRDGKKVDGLVKMPKYSVPIDAKFPLNNFEKLQQTNGDGDRLKARREFLKDVRNHIDKISASYIKPEEGTLDFAIMFMPAENIYYEAMVKNSDDNLSIQDYALQRKVFPVSPNLLYIYLMTIVMGLHGMQIEKQAAEIRQNLNTLKNSFGDFLSMWDTLGNHLRNAQCKHDEGQKKLDKFVMQLQQIKEKEPVN
ncbi:MAG: DNA recombination protein RmuC [Phycisphaerales bacterium]